LDKQPHPLYADRWADGTVRVGNDVARKHGADSGAVKRGQLPEDLRVTIDEFRSGLITDQGGAEELTTLQAGYITRLTDLEVCSRLLQADLVARGLITPKGRVRSSYDRLLATFVCWDRFAQRLGFERRARPIPSLQEYLERATPAQPITAGEPDEC
jgi:hypothetical protein